MKIGFLEVPFNEIGASSLLEKVYLFQTTIFQYICVRQSLRDS
jgi:hypothetical protein